jgi:hypothetical protein
MMDKNAFVICNNERIKFTKIVFSLLRKLLQFLQVDQVLHFDISQSIFRPERNPKLMYAINLEI